jgi:hypothetical protein
MLALKLTWTHHAGTQAPPEPSTATDIYTGTSAQVFSATDSPSSSSSLRTYYRSSKSCGTKIDASAGVGNEGSENFYDSSKSDDVDVSKSNSESEGHSESNREILSEGDEGREDDWENGNDGGNPSTATDIYNGVSTQVSGATDSPSNSSSLCTYSRSSKSSGTKIDANAGVGNEGRENSYDSRKSDDTGGSKSNSESEGGSESNREISNKTATCLSVMPL